MFTKLSWMKLHGVKPLQGDASHHHPHYDRTRNQHRPVKTMVRVKRWLPEQPGDRAQHRSSDYVLRANCRRHNLQKHKF